MPKRKPVTCDIETLQDARSHLDAFESLDVTRYPDVLRDMTEQLVLFFAKRLINIDPYVTEDAERRAQFEERMRNLGGVVVWGDRRSLVHVDELILRFGKAAILRMVGQSAGGMGRVDTASLAVVDPNKAFGWTRKNRGAPARELWEKIEAVAVAVHVALLKKRGMNEADAITQAGRDFPGRRERPRNGVESGGVDRTSWVYANLKVFRELYGIGYLDEWTQEQLEAEAADCRNVLGVPETPSS